MKQKERIEYLEASVRAFERQVESLTAQNKTLKAAMGEESSKHLEREENLKEQLMKADIENSKGLADKLKVGQLEKQLSVINHITAGRVNEAVQEILTPMPVLFKMDIRFADDQSRIAAEDELLARLKKVIHAAVECVAVERETKTS